MIFLLLRTLKDYGMIYWNISYEELRWNGEAC
jgi:hypothetical protein